MGKYDNKWQKCDTDKILLGDTYRNLSRTKTKREIYEKTLNPPQRRQKPESAAEPRAKAESDKNTEETQPKESNKDQPQENGSEYSSEDDQNDQSDMCA